MDTFLLAVIALALSALAGAAWAIYGVMFRGFDQHIKALQALYEQRAISRNDTNQ